MSEHRLIDKCWHKLQGGVTLVDLIETRTKVIASHQFSVIRWCIYSSGKAYERVPVLFISHG